MIRWKPIRFPECTNSYQQPYLHYIYFQWKRLPTATIVHHHHTFNGRKLCLHRLGFRPSEQFIRFSWAPTPKHTHRQFACHANTHHLSAQQTTTYYLMIPMNSLDSLAQSIILCHLPTIFKQYFQDN